MNPLSDQHYEIGPFRLYPANRMLLRGDAPVRLGGRAMDLLLTLVERAGEVVPKDELVQRVWPATVVEETSLRVHIAALRKALGETSSGLGYIANVPGQGYSFVAPVQALAAPRTPLMTHRALTSKGNLPVRLARTIGRQDVIRDIAAVLADHRLVTITGEGGVGKTTLALSVAEEGADQHVDGTFFVDLSVLSDPSQVVTTVGRMMGAVLAAEAALQSLQELISVRHLMLVLDNCEHLVDSIASLVTSLLRVCPNLRVLATSREPLRAEGERVHRLEALRLPPVNEVVSSETALGFESIEFLVDRIAAAQGTFELSDEDAPHAAELCRQLDGIPLAIELAAARVGFFGLQGLLLRLSDRLNLLTAGKRTVAARHQTLRALYDWSFDLLDADCQRAFARLSVFAGSFSLEGALAVVEDTDRGSSLSTFLELISKSLVATDLSDNTRRYRLLESARVYAAEKLLACGGLNAAHCAHATYLVEALESANPEWELSTRQDWLARYGPLLNDVFIAFEWAASPDGDALLCARLAFESFQLVQQLSQLEQHRTRIEKALERMNALPGPPTDLKTRLTAALGIVLGHSGAQRHIVEAWLKSAVHPLPHAHDDAELLYGIWVTSFSGGDYRKALEVSERLEVVCSRSSDEQGVVIARRMQAQTWHFLGDHARSRALAEQVLAYPATALRLGGRRLDPVDRRASMRILLARIHWLEGDSERAWQLIDESQQYSERDMGYARCHVLALAAIPFALWSGDLRCAQAHLATLRQLIDSYKVEYWREWIIAFEWQIEGAKGPVPTSEVKLLDHLGTLGVVNDALLARAESGEPGWCVPELLRSRGEQLMASDVRRTDDAIRLFERALGLARRQRAVRWELRATISLARSHLIHGRPHCSAADLAALMRRIESHWKCPDLQQAERLLQDMTRASTRGE